MPRGKPAKANAVEKFPTKTKPVIAKNASGRFILALRVLMQVGEMLQNKNNLALNFQHENRLFSNTCHTAFHSSSATSSNSTRPSSVGIN